MSTSTPAQRKKIHALKSILGMDDLFYRDMLQTFHVFSSTALSEQQADLLICHLEDLGKEKGVYQRPYRRYEYLGKRPGYASPKQLRLIAGLWKDVSVQKTGAAREKGLDTFLQRFGIYSGLKDLRSGIAYKVVAALIAMQKAKKQGEKHV